MGFAVGTLTTISDALMNDYDPVIRDQVFSKTVLLDKLKRNVGVQPMKNNNFLIKLRATGHSGVYTTDGAASADLSTGQPTYDEATVPAKYAYGTHQIADTVLEAADGDAGAIVDIAEDFAQAVKLSMQKSLNRQFYQRGGTEANNAIIATVNGASSSTTVTVDSGAGSSTEGPGLGTRFIYPASSIDIGTDAEHAAGTDDQEEVSSVDSDTQITIAAAATVADGDHIKFRGGDDTEMNGLRSVCDTANTFQGVDRSSNFWAHAYLDSTGEALDEGDMVTALIEANKYGNVNAILTGNVLYRKYASLLTSLKRTADTKESLLGGFAGLEFASGGPGVVVMLDHDCPYGDMNFVTVDKNALVIAELAMGWLDRGTGVFQKTNLRPSWWASYRFYGNLACRAYKAHSALQQKTA